MHSLQKSSTIGLAAVTLSALALTGFSFGASTTASAKFTKGMNVGQKIQLCIEQRKADGYDNKNSVSRSTRRVAQANFRLCVREAVHGNRNKSSKSYNSKSSAMSASSLSSATASSVSSAGSMTSGSSQSSVSSQAVIMDVTIDGFTYIPSTITVKKGTTVRWTNNDSSPHTVTSKSGFELNSGTISMNGTYSHTFNSTGTFTYYCAFHPHMKATVVVTN